jgi:hypothetical protein
MVEYCEVDYRCIGKAQEQLSLLQRELDKVLCKETTSPVRHRFWREQATALSNIKAQLDNMRIDILSP